MHFFFPFIYLILQRIVNDMQKQEEVSS